MSVDQRVEELLDKMTLEEKVYQLCALRLGDGDEIFKSSGEYSIDYIRKSMGAQSSQYFFLPFFPGSMA